MPSTGGDLHRLPILHPPPPLPLTPFQQHLLEVTVVSAQDLYPAVKSSMRTYTVAWTDPSHKLRTAVDTAGHVDPTWNDKLVFRLDDETLKSDTSSINFDIFAARPKFHPGSDVLLGTARALVSTLHPTASVKFVALQVRRPSSLRPQGILNVGVSLADGCAKSMPLMGGEGDVGAEAGKLERSRSAREMERKLERWRVELPTVKDERETIAEEERGERVRVGKGQSRRTAGRMPWFGTAAGEGRGRADGGKLER